jgi:hypothetical protein
VFATFIGTAMQNRSNDIISEKRTRRRREPGKEFLYHIHSVQLGYLEVKVQEKLRSGWPGPFVKVEEACH